MQTVSIALILLLVLINFVCDFVFLPGGPFFFFFKCYWCTLRAEKVKESVKEGRAIFKY